MLHWLPVRKDHVPLDPTTPLNVPADPIHFDRYRSFAGVEVPQRGVLSARNELTVTEDLEVEVWAAIEK
jgi:hypothetical protein